MVIRGYRSIQFGSETWVPETDGGYEEIEDEEGRTSEF